MADLPSLVVHGWWINKVLVLFGAALAVALVVGVRRFRRVPSAKGPARGALLACALAGGTVTYFGLRAVGQHLIAQARAQPIVAAKRELRALDGLVVAAALPGVRDDALAELGADVALRFVRTPRAAALRVAIGRIQGGCGAAVRQRLNVGELVAAVADSASCPDAAVRASALVAAGQYEELITRGAFAAASPKERVLALIATRRWSDAAQIIADGQVGGLERRDAACAADLVRAFGVTGATGASTGLGDGGACAIRRAVQLPPAARVRAFAELLERPGLPAARDIAWAYGVQPHGVGGARVALVHPHADGADIRLWLSLDAPGGPATRAWAIVRAVYRGDFAAAERRLDELEERASTLDAADRAELPALRMAVAVRAGHVRVGRDWEHVLDDLELRTRATELLSPIGVVTASPTLVMADCRADARAAIASALDGDASELASLVEECPWTDRGRMALLAAAPQLTGAGRDRIARALTLFEPATRASPPFELVGVLTWQRDVLRALGDADGAAQRQAIIDRHLVAFGSREQLVALRLLQP